MEYNLTKSTRKFIRSEKARIRRQFLDFKKQEELITELYKKILGSSKVEDIKEVKQEKAEVKEEIKKQEVKAENSKLKIKKVHPIK